MAKLFSRRPAEEKNSVMYALQNESELKRSISSWAKTMPIRLNTNSRDTLYLRFVSDLQLKEDFDESYATSEHTGYTITAYVLSRLKYFLKDEKSRYFKSLNKTIAIETGDSEEVIPNTINERYLPTFEEDYSLIEYQEDVVQNLRVTDYYSDYLKVNVIKLLELMNNEYNNSLQFGQAIAMSALELGTTSAGLNKIVNNIRLARKATQEEFIEKTKTDKYEYKFYKSLINYMTYLVELTSRCSYSFTDLYQIYLEGQAV